MINTCTVTNCKKIPRNKVNKYCNLHYRRNLKHGNPLKTLRIRENHGLYRHALYPIWVQMKQRCNNKKCKTYMYYGGRGISVCERWQSSFKNFVEDMGERPIAATLDRIDNDGDYEPSNCRWANMSTQTSNRGDNRNNTSGYKGIVFRQGSWRVRIMNDYKEISLGSYTSLTDAIQARINGELKYK